MKSEYRIVPPNGKPVHIRAKTKSDAIAQYHKLTWMPVDFIKKHCTVKNLGRVE